MTRNPTILPATLSRAVRLIWLSDRHLAFWHTVATVLQALLPLAAVLCLKQVIDSATKIFQTSPRPALSLSALSDRYAADSDFRQIVLWALAGALCLTLSAALRLLSAWVAEFHSLAVTERVYGLLHEALARADYAFFENADDQNRLHMAREEALTRPAHVLAGLGQTLHSIAGLAGVMIILAGFSLWLPPLLALAALPPLCFKLNRARRFFEWRKSLAPLEREAAYFHSVLSDNAGAKDVRLYQHGDFCRGRFRAARERLREERVAWRRYVLTREAAGMAVGLLAIGLSLLWMTGRLLEGAATLGALVLCVQSVQRGQAALSALLNALAALFEDALFLQSFEGLLNQPSRICAPPQPVPVPERFTRGITFENVSFTYPGTDRQVLKDLCFTLLPGERVFLSGANGTGKSTVIKLLCRLYDPTQGRILVDGVDLRAFDPDEWRARVGALFQDFNHYQMTASDNIWIGHTRSAPDAPQIQQAAREAGLAVLLDAWPKGLQTLLGRWL
ncbi:MAG: ABC transporter ATP-binding protein, partial [Kiritimatiellae bacterium]|nr:ABC transporter ATP-binding protein [Kiritimatiellia bacterium]